MKKSSNKYVNYGIAFTLFGILVLSLSLNRMEGFDTEEKEKEKATNTNKTKKATDVSAIDIKKMLEQLTQMQHLAHLAKTDTPSSV